MPSRARLTGLFSLLLLLYPMAAVAQASPLSTSAHTPFLLRTHVTAGDASKDNLYVVAYHAYAGGNDVALLPNTPRSPATPALLNGTYVQFSLSAANLFPWGLQLSNLDGDSYWDAWNAVGINAGYGDGFNPGTGTGFVFGERGLTFDVAEFGFGGWLGELVRAFPSLRRDFVLSPETETSFPFSSCPSPGYRLGRGRRLDVRGIRRELIPRGDSVRLGSPGAATVLVRRDHQHVGREYPVILRRGGNRAGAGAGARLRCRGQSSGALAIACCVLPFT